LYIIVSGVGSVKVLKIEEMLRVQEVPEEDILRELASRDTEVEDVEVEVPESEEEYRRRTGQAEAEEDSMDEIFGP
jgi:hypothetical protein